MKNQRKNDSLMLNESKNKSIHVSDIEIEVNENIACDLTYKSNF